MAEITRANALALIATQGSAEIIEASTYQSVALRTFRRTNMGTSVTRMALIDALADGPTAFLTSDTGRKPIVGVSWREKTLTAQEIACVAVVPENVLDDSSSNVWGEVRDRIAERIAITLDTLVFFGGTAGVTSPTDWAPGIVKGATDAGNTWEQGTAGTGGNTDRAEAINQTLGLVEQDGFDPTQGYATRSFRVGLRGLRDNNGSPIWESSLADANTRVESVWGVPLNYVAKSAWDTTKADAVFGQADRAVIGVRQDITVKPLDQAVLQNPDGTIARNLAQEDALGLRVKARFAFQVLDEHNVENASTGYPFAALVNLVP